MATKKTLLNVKLITYAFFTFHFSLFTLNSFSQGGAAINATGGAADNSAMLDVGSTNQGILIPRVALTSATDITTIASPAASLLIYNTATAGTSPDNVIPGFYFYTTTSPAKWVPFTTGTPFVDPTNLYTTRGW
ncbi:MAG: hypothetical protein HGB12_07295 [Bacteroidetes bacterium]|nr:hypothetical protein [Bacteroidota bacterium]